MQTGMFLVRAVEERLSDSEASRVGLGSQPIPWMLALGNYDLEAAVRLEVHLLLVHGGTNPRSAAAESAPREEIEADPFCLAPRAPYAVVVLSVERGAKVV